MEREELLRSKEYWTTTIQTALFEGVEKYLMETGMTKKQLAAKLGLSTGKGYVKEALNGDFDHKLSKLVELLLACNIAPVINFVNLKDFVARETKQPTGLTFLMNYP